MMIILTYSIYGTNRLKEREKKRYKRKRENRFLLFLRFEIKSLDQFSLLLWTNIRSFVSESISSQQRSCNLRIIGRLCLRTRWKVLEKNKRKLRLDQWSREEKCSDLSKHDSTEKSSILLMKINLLIANIWNSIKIYCVMFLFVLLGLSEIL